MKIEAHELDRYSILFVLIVSPHNVSKSHKYINHLNNCEVGSVKEQISNIISPLTTFVLIIDRYHFENGARNSNKLLQEDINYVDDTSSAHLYAEKPLHLRV